MAFDATVGGASANSYLTVDEADAVLEGRLHTDAWDAATTAQKEAALRMATRILDSRVCWLGTVAASTQALVWPRTGLLLRTGAATAADAIPTAVQEATAELALMLLSSDVTVESDASVQGLTRLKAASVELEWRDAGATWQTVPRNVLALIPDAWICPETDNPVIIRAVG